MTNHIAGKRCDIKIENGFIYKTVSVSPSTKEVLTTVRLNNYIKWLEKFFLVPNTEIFYDKDVLTFKQNYIEKTDNYDPIEIARRLMNLKLEKEYGLDSNPGNFVFGGNNQPFFVDFFPFLFSQDQLLLDQFGQAVETTKKRYFTIENIVIFFIIRLFREDWGAGLDTQKYCADFIKEALPLVCDREKRRYAMINLLNSLNETDTQKKDMFIKFYDRTKNIQN